MAEASIDSHTRHELRTPLNQILGYTEMLLEDADDAGSEALAADLRRILDAGRRLLAQLEVLFSGRAPGAEAASEPSSRRLEKIVTAENERVQVAEPSGRRILVVDDDPDNREVLARRLRRLGHDVSTAGDGVRALEALAAEACDLVLLDLMMPEMDGYETLRRLKANKETYSIPVIMISAAHEVREVAKGIALGAEDYLSKPFDPVLLHARVSASLEKKRLNDLERQHLRAIEAANRELRETQVQLVEAEKIAALGRLVAGIAHEINTPLGALQSMIGTLDSAVEKIKGAVENDLPEGAQPNRKLTNAFKVINRANAVMNDGAERVSSIVHDLRRFARLDEADFKQADINQGILDTLNLIGHELKPRVRFETSFSDLPPVACYPRRLNQAVLSLVVNGSEAIRGKGVVEVSTRRFEDKIEIAVRDNGCGIPEEIRSKIFDPGFTTKGVGVGTGLGLPTCYQIVKDHQGSITVESEECKGTVVRVLLPLDLTTRLQGAEASDSGQKRAEP